jgi:hypothetical protein
VIAAVSLADTARGSADPAFSARVNNPWFPLFPGATYVYIGVKDGKTSRDIVTVTHRRAMIGGAP